MAYLAPSYAQDPRRQQLAAATDPTTGGGAPADSGGAAPGAETPSTTPDTGSGWTNLQEYLTPGNLAAGKQMGDQITGQVAGDVKSAQDAVSQYGQTWKDTNQNALDAWFKQSGKDTGGQAAYDANAEAEAKRYADTFASEYNGFDNVHQAAWDKAYKEYKGKQTPYQAPAAVNRPAPSAWSPDLSGVTKAEGEANALSAGQPGAEAYLRSKNGPGYTSGMAGLDAYLLGAANPGMGEAMQGYAKQAADLENTAQPALGAPVSSVLDPRPSQKPRLQPTPQPGFNPMPHDAPGPKRRPF